MLEMFLWDRTVMVSIYNPSNLLRGNHLRLPPQLSPTTPAYSQDMQQVSFNPLPLSFTLYSDSK